MKRRTLALPAAVVLTLALGACSSTQQPGAAALIDGTAISDSTVAELVTEVGATTGEPSQTAETNRKVISVLVQDDVINRVAVREGINVTETQVQDLINGAAKQAGGMQALQKNIAGQYGVAPSQLNSFARANLQFQELAAKLGGGDANAGSEKASLAVSAASEIFHVSINPRFGTWDPKALNVGPAANLLSKPAA